MKRIYIPGGIDGFELCHPLDERDFERINLLVNGESRLSTWVPLEVKIVKSDRGAALYPSDSPWLGEHALVFKGKAVRALSPILGAHGELLPLMCSGEDVKVFNSTLVLDALNLGASNVVRFKSGRLMDVKRYVFKPDVVRDVEIFRIPDFRSSPTFVSDRFVDAWNRAGLIGLEFQPIWSEEGA